MKAQADKAQDNKSQSVVNKVPQKQKHSESAFQLEDNRPEAIARKRLQEVINNSPRVKQLTAIREMANSNPRIRQLKAIQDMANNSPRHQHTLQLQAKMQAHTIQKFTQFMKPEEEEEKEDPLQGKFEASGESVNPDSYRDQTPNPKNQIPATEYQLPNTIQKQSETPAKNNTGSSDTASRTGLPDTLKSGIENLSGHSMDDVKVHYNSDKPTQLNAHAYAQGTDIHLASGQEKHLPHEAWHVVQQKQGRVKPTMQLKGKVNINDDTGLEKEADVMGAKALQMKPTLNSSLKNSSLSNAELPVQRAPKEVEITWEVTHLVKKMNDSIFGGKDFTEGEIGEAGELAAGQRIIIDDEKTFLSRRGSNQENPEKRMHDKSSIPSVLWYHVLFLDKKNVSGQKLYIRENTFAVATSEKTEEKLSVKDQETLVSIVKIAASKAPVGIEEVAHFIVSKLKKSEAPASRRMIEIMHSLYVLGILLKKSYSGLDVYTHMHLEPGDGIKLIAPFVSKQIKKSIGITVNAMDSGGNHEGWKSLDQMMEYLQISFDVFLSTFKEYDSDPTRLRLLKTLRSSDSNIEKFITLMQGIQMEALLAGSGPQQELESEMAGNSTASGGNGRGLIDVAFAYIHNKYLKSKYTQDQIDQLDYDDTREDLKEWLNSNGYTFTVIRDAVRNSARDKSATPIELSDVESRWSKVYYSQYL